MFLLSDALCCLINVFPIVNVLVPFGQQIAELKAKRDQNQEQERQKKARMEHLEKTAKHQQQELKKRASQVAEFERVRPGSHVQRKCKRRSHVERDRKERKIRRLV